MKKALLIASMASTLERFCKVNMEVLREQGYELHLAANFASDTWEQTHRAEEYLWEAEDEGIIVHPIGFERRSFFKNIKNLRKLKRLLKNEQFDLIHAHTETGGMMLALAAAKAGGAKLIFTPHGMSFYKGSSLKSRIVYRPIERWICNKCNAVIAINQEELQVLKKWNEKTAFFTHGIGADITPTTITDGLQKRTELGIPPGAVLLTSLGELDERKNHLVCIRAISKIGKPNIYYLICGDGKLRGKLLREAERFGVGDRVVMPGFRRDVADILACSDIFVFPSYYEGLSVALMEAMNAGLPVVCSRIRGNVDLIEEGKSGYLIEPTDSAGFAKAIELLAELPKLRLEMGERNKKDVKNYSKEIVKGELINVYSVSGTR